MVNKEILCTVLEKKGCKALSRGKCSALSAPCYAPAQGSTSQLGLQGDGATAASTSSKKHGKRQTATTPPVLYNAAPQLHTSCGTPDLAMGIPSMPQSRGALASLCRGCCRAGMDPVKQWEPHCREALRHGRVSLCRAPTGRAYFSTALHWHGLLQCCEMGSCNMRPALPRKRQSGKTLRCQAFLFQQHQTALAVPGAGQRQVQGKQSCPLCPVCSEAMVFITAMVSLLLNACKLFPATL